MTRSFRVTPRAAQDLRDIARYTLRTWGRKRRDTYLKAIDQRFSWLAENPEFGKPRPDIKDGYYSYPQGSHLIFYLVRQGGIDIIRIPHQRMDVLDYWTPASSRQRRAERIFAFRSLASLPAKGGRFLTKPRSCSPPLAGGGQGEGG